mgnify:CR=1 FL=1
MKRLLNHRELLANLWQLLKWTVLVIPVGVLAGSASAFFLWSLDRLRKVVGASGTTRLAYSGSQLLMEFNTAGVLTKRYVAGPGVDEPLVWYEGSTTTDRRWAEPVELPAAIAGEMLASAMRLMMCATCAGLRTTPLAMK